MTNEKKADEYSDLPQYSDYITNEDLQIDSSTSFAGTNWAKSSDVQSSGYYNQEDDESKSVPNAKNHNWLFKMFYDNLAYLINVVSGDGGLIDQITNKVASSTKIGQVKIGSGLNVDTDGTLNVYDVKNANGQYIYNLPVGAMMFLPFSNGIPEEYITFNKSNQSITYKNYPDLIDTLIKKDSSLIGLYSEASATDNCLFYYTGTAMKTTFNDTDTFIVKDLSGCFARNVLPSGTVGKVTPDQLRSHQHTSLTMGLSSNLNGGDGNYVVGSPNSNISSKKISGTVEIGSGVNIYDEDSQSYVSDTNVYGETAPKNIQLVLVMKAKKTTYSFTSTTYDIDPNPVGTVLNVLSTVEIINNKINTEYKGYKIADGSVLKQSDYPDLFEVLPQGNYTTGKHGYTWTCDLDGTYNKDGEYFVLPNLLETYARYSTSNPGAYQSSAIPNIKGKGPLWYSNQNWFAYGEKHGHTTGPFYIDNVKRDEDKYGIQDAANSNNDFRMWFDASRANSVYQDVSEVRPNSINEIPLIKYKSNREFEITANISL